MTNVAGDAADADVDADVDAGTPDNLLMRATGSATGSEAIKPKNQSKRDERIANDGCPERERERKNTDRTITG